MGRTNTDDHDALGRTVAHGGRGQGTGGDLQRPAGLTRLGPSGPYADYVGWKQKLMVYFSLAVIAFGMGFGVSHVMARTLIMELLRELHR